MLDAGADSNIHDDSSQGPLMMATNTDYVDVVTQLLKRGAQAELKENSEKSVLDLATKAQNKELISTLTTKYDHLNCYFGEIYQVQVIM